MPPGIMTNIGVLTADGKLNEEVYSNYVNDVIKELKNNVEGSDVLYLNNRELYPDFHEIWHPRYENMAKSLDVDGATPFASLFVVDPTAIAATAGLNPPIKDGQPLTAKDVLDIITDPTKPAEAFGAIPPTASPIFPELNLLAQLGDVKDPAEVAKITGDVAAKAAGVIVALAAASAPPLPPIPEIPDPFLLEAGYTDQYEYEIVLAMSPVTTQVETAKALIAQIPPTDLIKAMTNLPQGLYDVIADVIKTSSPQSMSTSDVEQAAQKVLSLHQAKLNAAVLTGTMLGNGSLVTGLASTPEDAGGFGILLKESEEIVAAAQAAAEIADDAVGAAGAPIPGQNSSLNIPDEFIKIPDNKQGSRYGATIRGIVIHTAQNMPLNVHGGDDKYAGPGTAKSVAQNNFANAKTPKQNSAHYVVDSTAIIQCVNEDKKANHATIANRYTIGIETAGSAARTTAEWHMPNTQQTLKLAAKLVRQLCVKYGIPIVHVLSTEIRNNESGWTGICGHGDINAAFPSTDKPKKSQFGHNISTNGDPGPNFPWDEFLDMVKNS